MDAHRRQRLTGVLEGQGLDALVATTTENVYYVSGLRSISHALFRGLELYAVFTRRGTGLVIPFIDTTGAGDAYAAGFLYGLLSGADLVALGQSASRTASAVISRHGPQLQQEDAEHVAAGVAAGKSTLNVKVVPTPGLLCTPMAPPINPTRRFAMASPRPVPPYLRAIEPSACSKDSKMRSSLPTGMPMPVS